MPPFGLGIIPLLEMLQSPVATMATLFLVHALYNIPRVFFNVLVSSFVFHCRPYLWQEIWLNLLLQEV